MAPGDAALGIIVQHVLHKRDILTTKAKIKMVGGRGNVQRAKRTINWYVRLQRGENGFLESTEN